MIARIMSFVLAALFAQLSAAVDCTPGDTCGTACKCDKNQSTDDCSGAANACVLVGNARTLVTGPVTMLATGAVGASSSYCASSADGKAATAGASQTLTSGTKIDFCETSETCNNLTKGAVAAGTAEKALCLPNANLIADTKKAAGSTLICLKTNGVARSCKVDQVCTKTDGFCDGSLAPGGPNPFTALLAVALAA